MALDTSVPGLFVRTVHLYQLKLTQYPYFALLPACLPTHLPTYLLTFPPIYLPTCLLS